MIKIINEGLLSKSEFDSFLSSNKRGRGSMYADILNKLYLNPVGYKIAFQVPAGFKFNAPYTLAQSMGFKFSFRTIAKGRIEIVKTEEFDTKQSQLHSIMEDIFGKKVSQVSEFDATKHRGALKDILSGHLKSDSDKLTVIANSSNTIHKAATSIGKNVATKNLTKNRSRGPFKFLVTQKRKSA